jgi:phosphohistidine phosphatase
MEIYILRHGIADPRELGLPDGERKLTVKGRQALQTMLELARKVEVRPEIVFTSPLKRAQETAAMASEVLACPRLIETSHLLPTAAPSTLWREITAHKDVSRVLVTGHEPHLGHFIGFLLEVALIVDLKKGSLVRVTTRRRTGPPRGVLKWFLTPKLAK